ncbi:MAG: glutathione-disulfide reductase [Gammaproteobacteria bacterium]|nr:MAG: glutathione-disulfide reductase [Gammaproteobacteria bacterium]
MTTHYNLICIGGGSGGLAAARRAAEYGAKVLVIEAKALGGTCVNVGCVPKKIAWHAGQLVDFVHLAKDYGFDELKPKFNYRQFADKRDAFIAKLNGLYKDGLDNAAVDIVRGYAKFVDNNSVVVGEHRYTADHIVIAVGGEAQIPAVDGAHLGMDSDDFFALRQLPTSIAIVGAGYIAVELAGMLNTFGVKTHLLVRKKRFLKQVDDDINQVLTEQMQKDGVCIHFERQIESVTEAGNQLNLSLNNGDTLRVDQLLWAIGRTPMTDAIGLQNTAVECHANGNIVVDEQQNTSVNGIYAIGDITGQPTLTPAAIEAGRQLAERLFNRQKTAKADFTYVPTVIFSHPAIGMVGLTEGQAVKQYGQENITVYRSRFNPLLRSMTEHKVPTLMKMICLGEKQTVIGLHVVGDFADEIIQGFAVAVQMGATKADFDRTLAIHPTSGEEFVTMR